MITAPVDGAARSPSWLAILHRGVSLPNEDRTE
jgi:hypothetical protein